MVAGGKPASQGVAKKPVTPAKPAKVAQTKVTGTLAAKKPAAPVKAAAPKPLPASLVAQKSRQTTPKGTATKAAIQQHAITYARPLPAPKAAAPAAARANPGENAAAAVGRGIGALLKTGLLKR